MEVKANIQMDVNFNELIWNVVTKSYRTMKIVKDE